MGEEGNDFADGSMHIFCRSCTTTYVCVRSPDYYETLFIFLSLICLIRRLGHLHGLVLLYSWRESSLVQPDETSAGC